MAMRYTAPSSESTRKTHHGVEIEYESAGSTAQAVDRGVKITMGDGEVQPSLRQVVTRPVADKLKDGGGTAH